MKNLMKLLPLLIVISTVSFSFGQLPTRIIAGQLKVNDGALIFRIQKYSSLADSLDKVLLKNNKDTTALFQRALLLNLSNTLISNPKPMDEMSLLSLQHALQLVERTLELHMVDIRVKVLRAQVYKDLAYRYFGDEAYHFSAQQIASRRKQFKSYKDFANRYYKELAVNDSKDAYDFRKLKINFDYPIR